MSGQVVERSSEWTRMRRWGRPGIHASRLPVQRLGAPKNTVNTEVTEARRSPRPDAPHNPRWQMTHPSTIDGAGRNTDDRCLRHGIMCFCAGVFQPCRPGWPGTQRQAGSGNDVCRPRGNGRAACRILPPAHASDGTDGTGCPPTVSRTPRRTVPHSCTDTCTRRLAVCRLCTPRGAGPPACSA